MSVMQNIVSSNAKELATIITRVIQSASECETENYDDMVRAFVEDASVFSGESKQIDSLIAQLQALKEYVPVEMTEYAVIQLVKPMVRDFFFKKISNEDEAFALYLATDFTFIGVWGVAQINGLVIPQGFDVWCYNAAYAIVTKGK